MKIVALASLGVGLALHLFAADPAGPEHQLARQGEEELAAGQYNEAFRDGIACANRFASLSLIKDEIGCWTIAARAQVYLGRYPEASSILERAAARAHDAGFGENEAAALNDLGSARYYTGDYTAANDSFSKALAVVDAAPGADWYPRMRQITVANLAMLQQRLGQYEQALEMYRGLESGAALRTAERARLLSNIGALYRRLGDPYKAVERYQSAEKLFDQQKDQDGEIGVATNRGIALAMDLDDLTGAVAAFATAERLAASSGNRREQAEATLYASEALRRLSRYSEAEAKAAFALDLARQIKAPEETWKAILSLGRIAEARGDAAAALGHFREAIAAIEQLRTSIAAVSMRAAFLGDKTQAYDGAIRVLLQAANPDPAELFHYMEQSRARTLRDRLNGGILSLVDLQRRIPARTAVVEYWRGAQETAAIWITSSDARLVRAGRIADTMIDNWVAHLKQGSVNWSDESHELGRCLLGALPLESAERLLIVPDRRLQAIPFEALEAGNGKRLIDRAELSYLPAASLLSNGARQRGWLPPWRTMLTGFAFGAQPSDPGLFGEALPGLPGADAEIRTAASRLGGRAVLHSGADNLKAFVTATTIATPLLHFATHGIADPDDPDRSRLAFAAKSARGTDYLFAREIYNLKLSGVLLATLAACDTETGKDVSGEGTASLSRAFLAAGAQSTVSSLWRVSDAASLALMRHFYQNLAGGEPAARALRHAKLQLRLSRPEFAHPRYWAAYVLSGDPGVQPPHPTRALAGVGALLIAAIAVWALVAARARLRKPAEQTVSART